MSKRDLTIEPDFNNYGAEDGVKVVEHDEYESWSVRAGMPRRKYIAFYDTVEEAKAEFPDAVVLDHDTKAESDIPMPVSPPSWFDPADAGECWSEEDY